MKFSNIKVMNVVEPIGVGLVDEAMIYMDGKKGWTGSFKNSTDISRGILAVGAMAGQVLMPSANKYFEPVAIAETALLTKSVFQTIKKAMTHAASHVRSPYAAPYKIVHGPVSQDLPAAIPVGPVNPGVIPPSETIYQGARGSGL
ncbi:MAG: hypothetical protein PHU23_14660 [Dehalococcoidales bacterium]|nr:hypothetical protein [Dehalococcoidales bacterium]